VLYIPIIGILLSPLFKSIDKKRPPRAPYELWSIAGMGKPSSCSYTEYHKKSKLKILKARKYYT
jgi:hypothetical protein